MKKYEVSFTTQVEATIDVKAKDEDDAIKIVEKMNLNDNIKRFYDIHYSNWDVIVTHIGEKDNG